MLQLTEPFTSRLDYDSSGICAQIPISEVLGRSTHHHYLFFFRGLHTVNDPHEPSGWLMIPSDRVCNDQLAGLHMFSELSSLFRWEKRTDCGGVFQSSLARSSHHNRKIKSSGSLSHLHEFFVGLLAALFYLHAPFSTGY